jgi:hypothetical protein
VRFLRGVVRLQQLGDAEVEQPRVRKLILNLRADFRVLLDAMQA